MCDCNKNHCGDCEALLHQDIGLDFRKSYDFSREMLDILLDRQEAANALILAATKVIEDGADDPVAVLREANNTLVLMAELDETIIDLIDFINEEEFDCSNCLCIGCPYASECGGDCYFDDEDFFVKPEEKEEPKE